MESLTSVTGGKIEAQDVDNVEWRDPMVSLA